MRSDERDKLSHFVITLVTLCNKLEMDGRRASKPKDKGAFHSTQNPEIWVGSSNGTDNFGLVRGPSVDNTLRDLLNSSYHTKVEFIDCFIIHSNNS